MRSVESLTSCSLHVKKSSMSQRNWRRIRNRRDIKARVTSPASPPISLPSALDSTVMPFHRPTAKELKYTREKALSRKAKELQDQLSRLGRAPALRGGGSTLRGRKTPGALLSVRPKTF